MILGVAYKADVSDVRESPALNLIHLLRQKGAAVSYNDPYVEELEVALLQTKEDEQAKLEKRDAKRMTAEDRR